MRMTMNKQEEWEELIRSGFCQYNVSVPLHSIQYSNLFVGGPKYNKLLLYTQGDTAYYYENFADHHKVGDYCLNLFLKNHALFRRYLKFWHNEFKKLSLLFRKVRNTNLSLLSNKKLAELLEEVYMSSTRWHGIAYNVDAIDVVLNSKVEEVIKKSYPNETKTRISQIYNAITYPDVLSYVNRMELEKLKLLVDIKKNGMKKSDTKIKKFIEKYYWTMFSWKDFNEYDEKKLIEDIKGYSLESAKQNLTKEKRRFEESLKKKKITIKDIAKKQPMVLKYVEIFDEYAVLHDLRKEGQMKAVNSLTRIYSELDKRLAIKKGLIFHLWPMELVEIAKGEKKVDINRLEQRSKEWFCEYYSDGKCVEYFTDALKMRDKALGLNINEQQKEFAGLGASSGRVIGIAKVCLSSESAAKKIKPGDILVTGMTMPDFVPSMNKAAAIVTDEGGITCHAAIIARELGKPCVVGTKIATRIIKDGDTLEVNANHGVVKIIK
jgi:phosphohistidine swiveling domain-containing protein